MSRFVAGNMPIRVVIVLVVTLGLPVLTTAQDRSNENWFFGRNIGISFAGGSPTQISSPLLSTFEAASAISDPESGELLFYTDGNKVYNRNHQLMPNGQDLLGHSSSTQGALIMPISCDAFYIFTSDAGRYASPNNRGINYSIVDMKLAGGMGDVGNIKNRLLAQETGEKLTAVRHVNTRDFWLIGHGVHDKRFYAWHVSGFTIADPIISDVGLVHLFDRFDGVGQLKASPDGKRLALTTYTQQKTEVFDFDNVTGKVSNPIRLNDTELGYGVTFSPDNSKLYVSDLRGDRDSPKLVQYDLRAGTAIDIRNSMQVLYNGPLRTGTMQLGPDGKIYLCLFQQRFMGVINRPNEVGFNADFVFNQFPLNAPAANSLGIINLYDGPPLVLEAQEVAQVDAGEDQEICFGASLILKATAPEGRIRWTPSTGLNDPNVSAPLAKPTRSTKYIVTYSTPCGTSEDEVLVTVLPEPDVTISETQFLCRGDSIQLRAFSDDAVSYEWFPTVGLSDPRSPEPMAAPDESVEYTVRVTNDKGCTAEASVRVRLRETPFFDLGPDTVLCGGMPLRLQASGAERYEWWPAEGLNRTDIANPIVRVKESTTYYVRAYSSSGCSFVDSIRVIIGGEAEIELPDVIRICRGESIRLPLEGPGGNYEWSPAEGLDDPNSKNPLAAPERSIDYRVELHSDCGTVSAVLRVEVLDPPPVSVGGAQRICQGETAQLSASGGLSYQWRPEESLDDPGSANPGATPAVSTEYTVTITAENGCQLERSVTIEVEEAPRADAGDDVVICPNESIQLQASGGLRYEWSPAEGLSAVDIPNPIATPKATSRYTVRVWNAEGCSSSATVQVSLAEPANITIIDDEAICPGESIRLFAGGGSEYRWEPAVGLDDPGIDAPLATPNATTVYTVFIENEGCEYSRSVTVTVLPAPAADAGPDARICRGESLRLRAGGGQRYEWRPSDGLDDPTSASPLARPERTQTYTLTAWNDEGCMAVDDVTIEVLERTALRVSSDATICVGESVRLQADTEGQVRWEPVDGLDDPTSRQPLARPLVTTRYTVSGSDGNDCNTSASVLVQVEPILDISLALLEPDRKALPGEQRRLRLRIDRPGTEANWSPGAFDITLNYDHRRIAYVPQSIVNGTGMESWILDAEEEAVGSNRLRIRGSGESLPASSELLLDFIVYLDVHDDLAIALSVAATSFGEESACMRFGSTEIPLDPVCLHTQRGISLSGIGYRLAQPAPNPASGEVRIDYSLGMAAPTSLTLYNQLGQAVAVPVREESQQAGSYRLRIPTADLPAGRYYYRLRSGPFSATRSLVLTK